MRSEGIRSILRLVMVGLCLVILASCRRSVDAGRAEPQTSNLWALTLAAPIDHLDVVACEPMIVEHPDGTLFVGGYGAAMVSGKETDEATLWKSRDGGGTWTRVNVGTPEEGAAGNSDIDLAVSPDGTLYFANLVYDVKANAGQQISLGVSRDVGATWKWALLSRTKFDDRPWVKVAPDGTAHVIWNDGAGVCHAVSKDRGLTWTEGDRIHPQGGSSHLAVGPNGEVAVRVVPISASGMRYDEGVDLIAVSTDGGMTWTKHDAPGYREWNIPSRFPVPRWIEPLAWDARGALYSFWTNLKGLWLARSFDRGVTWTTWRLRESPEVAYYPYLVARGRGELAATWFAGWTGTWHARVARIDVGEGEAPPRMAEAPGFKPDSWVWEIPKDFPPVPDTAGEYLPVLFLRSGGLAVVSPISNPVDKRFGFSFWKLEEHREEAAYRIPIREEGRSSAAQPETVYSESPAAWFEVANNAAKISSDGKWALYHYSFGRVIKLINLETGAEEAERLAAGMTRVFGSVFYRGSELARLGEQAGQRGWFLPGPDGLRLFPLPADAMPQWSPDGSAVAYFQRNQAGKGLFVGDAQSQKQFSIEGTITGLAWSPEGRMVYALAWHENGLTSLVRINRETGALETLAKDLDALPRPSSGLAISGDGRRLYMSLASPAAPVAEARHQPDADRDLDIYELEPATGARRAVVQAPGDDFSPCVANSFLYWTHNDIHDSVVVFPSSGGVARVVEDHAEIPYWSNDGKQIAFTYGGWRLADWALSLDAGIVDVDSQVRPRSKMRPIVTGYHEDFTPTWSPDGKWIAYHSHRSSTPVASYEAAGSTDDQYLRRASGRPSEEIRLTDFGWEDGVADWSPDSHRLVFDSCERGGPAGVSKPWIVTIDPATGKTILVERLPLPDPIINAAEESWSPKGDEIALEEDAQGGRRILWVVRVDGKSAQKLVEYKSSTYGGTDWTPDGKTIVYAALAGERMQIFAVPRSGGEPRQLTDDPANLMHPQVSPDGRWIACTRMAQTKEIRRKKL
jgi:Tol biopolymer transport system component